jgi:hypothetical protein
MADTPKQPLGQSIRDLLNPAFEDERRPEIQNKIVSDIFAQLADSIAPLFEQEFSHFFNHVAAKADKKPLQKTPIILHAMTLAGKNGDGAYSPVKELRLPIVTKFTNFSTDDIKDMPGYIKLHEVCRDMDIAIKLIGLTADEARGSMMPPILTLDATKSYTEGAMENAHLYPNLPPKKVEFDRKSGRDFSM